MQLDMLWLADIHGSSDLFLIEIGGRMGRNTGGGGRTKMRGERENCDWTVKQTNKYIKRIALEIIVYYWKDRKF